MPEAGDRLKRFNGTSEGMAELRTPDLCVVGAGPAGLAAALAGKTLGAEVVLVEADRPGGRRLTGSAVARSLAGLAARIRRIGEAEADGIRSEVSIDFAALMRAVRERARPLERELSAQRLAAQGIEIIPGEAAFSDRRRLRVGDTTVRARRFILATGSEPTLPAVRGFGEIEPFTEDSLVSLPERPRRPIVLSGSGATALELAQSFARLGSAVTLVSPGPPLPEADPELVEIMLRHLEAEGVEQHWNAEILAVEKQGEKVALTLHAEGGPLTLEGTHLMAVGFRRPAVSGLGLERAGVRLTPDGRGVAVDRSLRTTNPRIYAAGEVNRAAPSDALAEAEGRMAARHALLGTLGAGPAAMVPRAVFTDPGIAEIGLGEPAAAARRSGRYKVHRLAYGQSDRARLEGRPPGLVKLVTEPSGRILGAGILGAEAAELIAIVAFAMDRGVPVGSLGHFVPPYPAFADLLRQIGEQAGRGKRPGRIAEAIVALRRLGP